MSNTYLSSQLVSDSTVCSHCNSNHLQPTPVASGIGGQFQEFFMGLFNTSDWPARWHCGEWSDFHGWLYIVSDLMIWAAYFAIPILLILIIRRRNDVPFLNIFWLFIAFILFCGSTHFVDAMIFWWPAYRLSALLRFFTAIVSIITVCSLYKLLPTIFSLRTQEELQVEIEERKKAEEETRILLVREEATKSLMNKKDEFMSIASHELKTPITTLKSSLQLLQRMMSAYEEADTPKMLIDKAVRQTGKLTSIINDLLDVTKIQAGKIVLKKTDFNLLSFLKESVEECELEGSKHQMNVFADAEIIMNADKSRIDQVLCNLITNAIKYSPGKAEIDISAEKLADGKVKVAVVDYGIGIPKDQQVDVFDRFFRVESTSQNFSGIGLGLYISAEIIKSHGGEIGVYSELGKGSTFWFTI